MHSFEYVLSSCLKNDSDVGSSYPGAEAGAKGLAVRQLKRYASWVQTVEKLYIGF